MNIATLNFLEIVSLVFSLSFLVFLPLELFQRWRRGMLNRTMLKEMLASSSPLLPTLLLFSLVNTLVLTVFVFAQRFAIGAIPVNGWTALLCLVCIDFLYYIDHRCGHRIRAYWAISHSVHHSSNQYDQTTAFRISFVDAFFSPWFYLPAVLIGFHPLLVLSCFGFILAYQQWLHTETIGKLPWLDPWLNTPSNHRVHHGSQAQYLDKNYGAVLMLWDHLFKSYQAEQEEVVYGLTNPIAARSRFEGH